MRSLVVTALVITSPLGAQSRMPDSLVNTQVIPHDTPVRQVVDEMRAITGALGVRCSYCHVGDESTDLWDYDFASDEKPAKLKARVMMEMVNAINGEHLGKLADIGGEGLNVTCQTCHRGVALPIPLEDLLLKAHAEGGYSSMTAKYSDLRQEYYGSDSYDFGEGTLQAVGASLLRRGEMEDAVQAYVMNVGLFSGSARAHFRAGEAQLAASDTTAALASYRSSLQLDSTNRAAERRIEELTGVQ